MKLTCQNCGDEESAYVSIGEEPSTYPWEVFVHDNNSMGLVARPYDDEQTREFIWKQDPKWVEKVNAEIVRRSIFDCSSCGEEDCVRRTGEMVFEITEDFFFGDGTKTMRLGANFLETGQPAIPVDDDPEE